MSEIELPGDNNESKKATIEETFLKVNLKVNELNSYELKSLYKFSYTSWGSKWNLSLLFMCCKTTKKTTVDNFLKKIH